MNAIWHQLILPTLTLERWLNVSYLHRWVGSLRQWRQTSWFMRWGDWIGALLAILVFVLAPFVNNVLTGLLMAACAAYWALLTISDGPIDRATEPIARPARMTPIHILVILYWTITGIATGLSPVKRAAFSGWTKLTLYMLLFALMSRVLRVAKIRAGLIAAYLHVTLVVSVYGLQQWFSGSAALATWVDPESPLSKTTRVYSYLGNPNLLAGYLVPAIVLSLVAVFAWQSWMRKALAVTMVLVNGACLVLTFSRGGWIGLVLSTFVLLLLLVQWWSVHWPRFWRIWALPIVLGTASTVVVLGVLVVPALRDRVASMFAGRGDSSNNFRINVWLSAIEMIQDHPILGIGPGNEAFNKVYPLYQKARFSALSAYSIVLEVLLEAGIIGFTCFVWLLTVIFSQGWVQLQRLRDAGDREGFWLIGAIASLVGMLGHGMVDTVIYRPEVNTLWWLMIALIASYYRPLPQNCLESGDPNQELDPAV